MVVYVVKEPYSIGEAEEILRKKADIEIKECSGLEQALKEGQKNGEEHVRVILLTVEAKEKNIALLQVQTFGNFEVFYMGKPILFTRAKSKELLAYLVDRRGASVTTAEACSVLWEDKEYNFSLQRQFQTVVSDLMKSLKKYNCAYLIRRRRNSISVNVAELDCDVCRLLEGDKTVEARYRGEYMSNYSWAEMTAGYLAMKYGYAKTNN